MYSVYGYPVSLTSLVEETLLSPLCVLSTLAEYQFSLWFGVGGLFLRSLLSSTVLHLFFKKIICLAIPGLSSEKAMAPHSSTFA